MRRRIFSVSQPARASKYSGFRSSAALGAGVVCFDLHFRAGVACVLDMAGSTIVNVADEQGWKTEGRWGHWLNAKNGNTGPFDQKLGIWNQLLLKSQSQACPTSDGTFEVIYHSRAFDANVVNICRKM